VKQSEAQIAELQKQLNKFGGKDVRPGEPNPDNNSMYPAIRELPLLGVKWADLYRELKVDETAYEMLRADYEIARVQEAKEVPTVQVIDPGIPAQKKSFPPRTLLALMLTFLGVMCACGWVYWLQIWSNIPPEDERKTLIQDVYSKISAWRIWRMRWVAAANRAIMRLNAVANKIEQRFIGEQGLSIQKDSTPAL
jgi:hypothetical protein